MLTLLGMDEDAAASRLVEHGRGGRVECQCLGCLEARSVLRVWRAWREGLAIERGAAA